MTTCSTSRMSATITNQADFCNTSTGFLLGHIAQDLKPGGVEQDGERNSHAMACSRVVPQKSSRAGFGLLHQGAQGAWQPFTQPALGDLDPPRLAPAGNVYPEMVVYRKVLNAA